MADALGGVHNAQVLVMRCQQIQGLHTEDNMFTNVPNNPQLSVDIVFDLPLLLCRYQPVLLQLCTFFEKSLLVGLSHVDLQHPHQSTEWENPMGGKFKLH